MAKSIVVFLSQSCTCAEKPAYAGILKHGIGWFGWFSWFSGFGGFGGFGGFSWFGWFTGGNWGKWDNGQSTFFRQRQCGKWVEMVKNHFGEGGSMSMNAYAQR